MGDMGSTEYSVCMYVCMYMYVCIVCMYFVCVIAANFVLGIQCALIIFALSELKNTLTIYRM
jgi:hypothetical protein